VRWDCSLVLTTFYRHGWRLQRIGPRVTTIVKFLGSLRTTGLTFGDGVAVEWVGIIAPWITQLAAIRTRRFGCREAAGRKSHSFGHSGRCWQLTAVFSTRGLAETSIANRCNQERSAEQINVSHWRSPTDVFRFSRAISPDGPSAIIGLN
jgi:hypothetical protein